MGASFVIRNYDSKDLNECRALWKELTDWHREIYRDASIGGEHPENNFEKHLMAVGPEHVWVAVEDFRVAGLVGLILRGDEAEVEPLIVAKAYRGRRIGTRLVEKAVAEARAKGVRILTVKPVARNIKTIQFLHKQGFRNIGFIELFIDFSDRSWESGPQMYGRDFRV